MIEVILTLSVPWRGKNGNFDKTESGRDQRIPVRCLLVKWTLNLKLHFTPFVPIEEIRNELASRKQIHLNIF